MSWKIVITIINLGLAFVLCVFGMGLANYLGMAWGGYLWTLLLIVITVYELYKLWRGSFK